MAAKKAGRRKYGKAAGKWVRSAMRRRKKGTLKSGPGGKGGTVTSRKQAIAIGLSEAREKGAKVPRKRTGGKKTAKKSTRKTTGKSARKTARTTTRKTTKKSARKTARKSTRKSARKTTRTSARKTSRKRA